MSAELDNLFNSHKKQLKNLKQFNDADKELIQELIYLENMTPSEAIKYVGDKKKQALIEELNANFFVIIG
tara:strand:- start:350 stop:559 length:210 start_codon:yes stop_codon:yes gene_type:complete